MKVTINHKTLCFERTLNSPATRVFLALRDPYSRSQWGPPSKDEVIEFTESNFEIGGVERSRCGERGNPTFTVEARYLDIIDNERILLSEVVSQGVERLSVSQVTMELSNESVGTRLRVVVQVASLVGPEMIEGYEFGWNASLNGLADYLTER